MLGIIQFKQAGGTEAHLINGQLHSPVRSMGVGTVHATEQAIRIKKSAFWGEGQQYTVSTNDGVSSWSSFDAGVAVLLLKDRGVVTLRNGSYVQFLQDDDGNISLRPL